MKNERVDLYGFMRGFEGCKIVSVDADLNVKRGYSLVKPHLDILLDSISPYTFLCIPKTGYGELYNGVMTELLNIWGDNFNELYDEYKKTDRDVANPYPDLTLLPYEYILPRPFRRIVRFKKKDEHGNIYHHVKDLLSDLNNAIPRRIKGLVADANKKTIIDIERLIGNRELEKSLISDFNTKHFTEEFDDATIRV